MRYLLINILFFITLTVQGQVGNRFEVNRGENISPSAPVIITDTLKKEIITLEESKAIERGEKSTFNAFEVSRNNKPKAINSTPIQPDERSETVSSGNDHDANEIVRGETKNAISEKIPIKDSIVTNLSPDLDSNPFDLKKNPTESKKIDVPDPVVKPKEDQHRKSYKSNTQNVSSSFPFWISLISIIIIALVVNLNKSLLSRLLNSFTNNNILKLNMRNDNGGINIFYIVIYIIFVLELSLFIYLYINLKLNSIGINTYWMIALCVLGVVLIKHLFLYSAGKIFHLEEIFGEFNFTILIYNLLFGIFLIPIDLLISYGPDAMSNIFLYGSIILGAFLALLCYVRSIFYLGTYTNGNILYFFLYLCTFEIVPILVLVKLYLNNI